MEQTLLKPNVVLQVIKAAATAKFLEARRKDQQRALTILKQDATLGYGHADKQLSCLPPVAVRFLASSHATAAGTQSLMWYCVQNLHLREKERVNTVHKAHSQLYAARVSQHCMLPRSQWITKLCYIPTCKPSENLREQ